MGCLDKVEGQNSYLYLGCRRGSSSLLPFSGTVDPPTSCTCCGFPSAEEAANSHLLERITMDFFNGKCEVVRFSWHGSTGLLEVNDVGELL